MVYHAEVQIRWGLQISILQFSSYYPTKPYVVGTQKNRRIETIRLSTHNIGLAYRIMILEQAKRSLSRDLYHVRKYKEGSITQGCIE